MQLDDIQKYKRLHINNDLSGNRHYDLHRNKPLTPHKWSITHENSMIDTPENTMDYENYSTGLNLFNDDPQNGDNEDNEYLKYKNQLRQLKEESKPSYQRGKNNRRRHKDS